MAVTDAVGGPFTPPGFYYKTFIRPRRLWPLYEKVLRHAAGLGKLRASQDEREWRTEYRRRHADVLVVGGGLAGLRGRDRAPPRPGADVVLADEGPEPGGRAARRGRPRARARAGRAGPRGRRRGPRLAPPRSAASTASSPSGRAPPCTRSARASSSSPPASIEQPLVFAGNDLPGVMLAGGARRLVALYGVAPGTRAVVATTVGSRARRGCARCEAAGVEVVAVADLREGRDAIARGRRAQARARRRSLRRARRRRRASASSATCWSSRAASRPRRSLLAQAGGRTAYDEARGHFAVAELPDGVLAAGAVAGDGRRRRALGPARRRPGGARRWACGEAPRRPRPTAPAAPRAPEAVAARPWRARSAGSASRASTRT